MYAQIAGGEVTAVGRLPQSARRQDSGDWVSGLSSASVDLQQACGWYEIVETPRPPVAEGEVAVNSLELVGGYPTLVWTVRPKTPGELAADAEQSNHDSVEQAARDALATNRSDITQAQAIASQADALSSATFGNNGQRDTAIRNLATGVRLLAEQSEAQARQLNGIIRLTLGQFDGTD